MKIWISHSFSDKEFVDKLCQTLLKQGHQILTLDDTLRAGEYILGRITESIVEADAFILLISKNNAKSSWINTEIGLMITELSLKNKKLFIPILIDKGIKLPSYLLSYFYVDFTNGKSFDENIVQVLKALNFSPSSENKLDLQKSLSEGLKQSERLLKVKRIEYEKTRKRQQSLTTFSIITLLSTLLTSIIVILYFIKGENLLTTFFRDQNFNIISFILGVCTAIISVFFVLYLKKRIK